MLPEIVWSMPPKGTFNLHASLLPQYRGAAPINWAIINGESRTGVTTFFIQQEIDTGEIIFQEEEQIREDDDVGSLYNRLMHKGAKLVLRTVEAIEQGKPKTHHQNFNEPQKTAPKIFKEISDEIKKGVDHVVQYRQDDEKIAEPSSLIKWNNGNVTILRT